MRAGLSTIRIKRPLVERLRHLAKLLGVGNFDIPAILNEAADEIEKLRESVRAAAIEECVQFLEREGHSIPAEKLRSLAPVVTRPDRGSGE